MDFCVNSDLLDSCLGLMLDSCLGLVGEPILVAFLWLLDLLSSVERLTN